MKLASWKICFYAFEIVFLIIIWIIHRGRHTQTGEFMKNTSSAKLTVYYIIFKTLFLIKNKNPEIILTKKKNTTPTFFNIYRYIQYIFYFLISYKTCFKNLTSLSSWVFFSSSQILDSFCGIIILQLSFSHTQHWSAREFYQWDQRGRRANTQLIRPLLWWKLVPG